jgi:hypothetical protein
MGFFTEMFARPRPQEQQRYRTALALLNAMNNADRADIGIKPADFPRDARKIGWLDADVGPVGIAHRVEHCECRAVTLLFLRPRPREHFGEEPHVSGP